MTTTLKDIELTEKLATLVHRFNELPKCFLTYSRRRKQHPANKTISLFWKWVEDLFFQDSIMQKQQMVWNRMLKDDQDRNMAHAIWNDIVHYTGNYLFQHLFPFMFAVKGEEADLNLMYYLMRKDPHVWSVV